MSTIAFIFARGGSKGLPGKNIRMLGGKPLIGWSIEQASAVKRINRIIVSTDSEDIATEAIKYGAEVPFIRPDELARDDSSEWMAWRHALKYLLDNNGVLPEVMLSLPATAPLRLPVDIDRCLDKYAEGDSDIVITVKVAHSSPYYNMVKSNDDGTVGIVIPLSSSIIRRQDAPEVFDMTTVAYVARPEFVMKHESLFEGRVRAVQVPVERAIDIDTLLDFQIAENLLSIRGKG